MNLISLLKKLPIDVGQAEKKHNTAGKMIAFSIVHSVPPAEGKNALDIGCRDGYWSECLKGKGFKVISLDIEPFYPSAIRHDVESGLPFGDKSFDLVWCTEVIEHLNNPKFLLQEIKRVIKPGGVAVLTTPNSGCWFYGVFKLWGWTPQKLQNPDHKKFFTLRDIKSLAPGYKIYGYFPYALFFFKISKLVGYLSPTFILYKKF